MGSTFHLARWKEFAGKVQHSLPCIIIPTRPLPGTSANISGTPFCLQRSFPGAAFRTQAWAGVVPGLEWGQKPESQKSFFGVLMGDGLRMVEILPPIAVLFLAKSV